MQEFRTTTAEGTVTLYHCAKTDTLHGSWHSSEFPQQKVNHFQLQQILCMTAYLSVFTARGTVTDSTNWYTARQSANPQCHPSRRYNHWWHQLTHAQQWVSSCQKVQSLMAPCQDWHTVLVSWPQDLYSGQSRSPHKKVAERPDPFVLIKTKLVNHQFCSSFKIKPCLAYKDTRFTSGIKYMLVRFCKYFLVRVQRSSTIYHLGKLSVLSRWDVLCKKIEIKTFLASKTEEKKTFLFWFSVFG